LAGPVCTLVGAPLLPSAAPVTSDVLWRAKEGNGQSARADKARALDARGMICLSCSRDASFTWSRDTYPQISAKPSLCQACKRCRGGVAGPGVASLQRRRRVRNRVSIEAGLSGPVESPVKYHSRYDRLLTLHRESGQWTVSATFSRKNQR
jgi:hypothetical protein